MRENNRRAGRTYQGDKEVTAFDKFSKFFGIILFIISLFDFFSDPPFLTIILSIAIIVGAVICLVKKYRLKGFTIIAILIALVCLSAGISQGKRLGFFKIPKDGDYKKTESNAGSGNDAPAIQVEINNSSDSSEVNSSEGSNTVGNNLEETASANTGNAEDELVDKDDNGDSTEDSVDSSASADAVNNDGVDPDLKAFLDSYEEFMDEYVVFMKKYMNDPTNAISMLSEYSTIMEKYTDFADKIEKYDEKEMSTADAKYYLEVVNRCNQKLLEVY